MRAITLEANLKPELSLDRALAHLERLVREELPGQVLIDYKGPKALKYFTTERGKIIPRRISGNCAKHQRVLTVAIKRARNIALLPFTTSIIK